MNANNQVVLTLTIVSIFTHFCNAYLPVTKLLNYNKLRGTVRINSNAEWSMRRNTNNDEFDAEVGPPIGEVVGSNGRIGSFICRSGNGSFASVPKDTVPGMLTASGCPIFVAVPATQISDVIKRTEPTRRDDLVFVTNGIPSKFLRLCNGNDFDEGTIVAATSSVPHFGVLQVGQDPISDASSPPTTIFGRHAQTLSDILTRYGITTEIVSSLKEVDEAAIRKLLWVSIMWLLCNDCSEYDGGTPITVTAVHERRGNDVRCLVKDTLPAANFLVHQYHKSDKQISSYSTIGSIDEVIEYMEAYSFSMPNAIPNKVLAIEEFDQRNGMLLSMSSKVPQSLHRTLVEKVVGYMPEYSTSVE